MAFTNGTQSSHFTAAEAARYLLEGDGSELDMTDSGPRNCGKLRYVYKLGSVSLSGKIPMTADANNNNRRVGLPVTGKCVRLETQLYSGDV